MITNMGTIAGQTLLGLLYILRELRFSLSSIVGPRLSVVKWNGVSARLEYWRLRFVCVVEGVMPITVQDYVPIDTKGRFVR